MGASHVKSGKPCQDYSLSWESDDKQTQVAIVCDGHGGETYVRSNIGSELAAKIALANIRNFISFTSPAMFLGKNAAITARPDKSSDALFPSINKVPERELTESEEEQLAQDEAFYAAVENVREQDYLFTRLFASIYLQWLEAIQKDMDSHPFSEEEKAHLKGAKVVKAYGSTLMAFVRTSLYWFAFHIGDGKLMACNRNMEWSEPVPWDCNCFLNVTTSLCNSDPIPMFRYAFSGLGDFPSAVILGSDGLDDSWGTIELLQNFYSQTLSIFDQLGEEQAIKELAEYLPDLSKKGSQDDMSMAGIIDMDEIRDAVVLFNVKREVKALNQEKINKQSELTLLKEQYESLGKEIDRLSNNIERENESFLKWLNSLLNQKEKRENSLQQERENLCGKKQEEENLRIIYGQKLADFQEWFIDAKNRKEELEKRIQSLQYSNSIKNEEDRKFWVQAKEAFECLDEKRRQEELKVKSYLMEDCNEEALRALNAEECIESGNSSLESLERKNERLEIGEEEKNA